MAIPTYYGMPPALFKALIERAQGILDWVTVEFRGMRSVWEGNVVVVLIVSNGGGREILRLVAQQLPNARIVETLFSYRDYGTPGYKGDLIKAPSTQLRLQELIKRMYAYLKST